MREKERERERETEQQRLFVLLGAGTGGFRGARFLVLVVAATAAALEHVVHELGQVGHVLIGRQYVAGSLLEFALQLGVLVDELGQDDDEQQRHDHHEHHGRHEYVEDAELLALEEVRRIALGVEGERVAQHAHVRRLDEIEATRAYLALGVDVDAHRLVDVARRRHLDHVRVARQARHAERAIGAQEAHVSAVVHEHARVLHVELVAADVHLAVDGEQVAVCAQRRAVDGEL